MEALETIHLSAKDLICPICYSKYGLTAYQPMSLSCGHNLCSHCLRRVRNCPLCRGKIHDRASFSKNVLITCILEQKEKIKECKIHNRPLEFFCKDHKLLLCVDCSIEGNHFSHSFVKCKEIDNRAEQIKGLMKKIDTKEEDSRIKFKTFLEKEKRDLKRKVDDILDEYIEPIMAIKKKLKREVDSFILSQSKAYEKETIREFMLRWKKDNESLVSKWEKDGEGDVAAQIVSNETEEIEKRITKFENRIEKVEIETGGKANFLLRDIKTRIGQVKPPWKKLKGRLNQLISMSKTEVDPRLEREYLAEFLETHGVMAQWIERDGLQILEVKGNGLNASAKQIEDKYFDCTLEKLDLHSFKVEAKQFEVVCKALERIISLLELKLFLQNVSDQELILLGESIQKIKSIESFNVVIISERVSEQSFKNFWVALSRLPKLKTLDVTLEDCDEVVTNQPMQTVIPIAKMKSLKELSIKLSDCDAISNESFGEFLLNLKGLTHLVKLNLMVCECKKLSYEFFDSLCKMLSGTNRLEELSLFFEGFYEASNGNSVVCLANAIAGLTKLKKLELSFADNLCLSAYAIKKSIHTICGSLTELEELNIDLSRCREVVHQTVGSIGLFISQLPRLAKLTLRFRMCAISEKGIAALSEHLSKLESLKFFTLDCRHCKMLDENGQQKALEHLGKLTRVAEKEFLFGELKYDQQQQTIDTTDLDYYNPTGNRTRLWSPMDGSVSFDESEILEFGDYDDDYDDYEMDDDDEDDDMDDDDEEEFEEEFELISVHTSETSRQNEND